MSDGRRRRRAKQARRDARRTKARDRKPPDEASFADVVRGALAGDHPLGLLLLASIVIRLTAPDPFAKWRSREWEPLDMDEVIASLTRGRCRESSALLAVLAALMLDDKGRQDRCRMEVLARNDSLPESISELPQIRVRRAVRSIHVLGDDDEILIGAQLAGGYDVTCVVHINHNMFSEVDDAYFVPASIDEVLSKAIEHNTDPDISFVDMSLADARAWIHHGVEMLPFTAESATWPDCRALVKWLIAHLPEGGSKYERPEWDWRPQWELVRDFFASPQGAPFNGFCRGELLLELIDSGTGDPLRWSAARIARMLDRSPFYDEHIPLDDVLEVPALLRAFIPFAHAQSGIREKLTAEALAAIDELSPAYKQAVLDKAEYWA